MTKFKGKQYIKNETILKDVTIYQEQANKMGL